MGRLSYNILLFVSSFFSWIAGKRLLRKEGVGRVLVVELTKLGDLVSTLPIFPRLKDFFPGASITALVPVHHVSLLALVPEVDEVLSTSVSLRYRDLIETVRLIRQRKFDFVLSASPSVRHGLLVLLSGARHRFGYLEYTRAKVVHLQPHRIRSLGFRLTNLKARTPKNITERVNQLCDSLGMPSPENVASSRFLGEASIRRRETTNQLGFRNGTPCIIIHPLSGWEYRSWPLEKFKELVQRILGAFSGRILVIGSESDRIHLQPLMDEFRSTPRVSFGIGAPLDGLAVTMAQAILFVGGDSGPLHLASAVGTPSVGLFGPAPPELTGPPVSTNLYLYKKVECSPCDQLDCVRKWEPCMTLISVDEVFERVCQLLREPSSRRVATLPSAPG